MECGWIHPEQSQLTYRGPIAYPVGSASATGTSETIVITCTRFTEALYIYAIYALRANKAVISCREHTIVGYSESYC